MKKRGESKYIKDLSVNIYTFVNDKNLLNSITELAQEVYNGDLSSLYKLTEMGQKIKELYPYYASTKVILHTFRKLRLAQTKEEAIVQLQRLGLLSKQNIEEVKDTYTPLPKKVIKQLSRAFKNNLEL